MRWCVFSLMQPASQFNSFSECTCRLDLLCSMQCSSTFTQIICTIVAIVVDDKGGVSPRRSAVRMERFWRQKQGGDVAQG